MKKLTSLILISIVLVGCNEVKTDTVPQILETSQTEELHDELYKKIKFHSCRADLFKYFTDKYETYAGPFFNESDRKDFGCVADSIATTQDTLAILYACDKIIK